MSDAADIFDISQLAIVSIVPNFSDDCHVQLVRLSMTIWLSLRPSTSPAIDRISDPTTTRRLFVQVPRVIRFCLMDFASRKLNQYAYISKTTGVSYETIVGQVCTLALPANKLKPRYQAEAVNVITYTLLYQRPRDPALMKVCLESNFVPLVIELALLRDSQVEKEDNSFSSRSGQMLLFLLQDAPPGLKQVSAEYLASTELILLWYQCSLEFASGLNGKRCLLEILPKYTHLRP